MVKQEIELSFPYLQGIIYNCYTVYDLCIAFFLHITLKCLIVNILLSFMTVLVILFLAWVNTLFMFLLFDFW
jgi:hypothetical protein